MQSYPTTSTNQYGIHPTSSDPHGHPTRPQPYFQGVCHLSLVPQVFAPNRIHLHLRDSPLSKGSIQETLCTLPPTRSHRNMDLQARRSHFPLLYSHLVLPVPFMHLFSSFSSFVWSDLIPFPFGSEHAPNFPVPAVIASLHVHPCRP